MNQTYRRCSFNVLAGIVYKYVNDVLHQSSKAATASREDGIYVIEYVLD